VQTVCKHLVLELCAGLEGPWDRRKPEQGEGRALCRKVVQERQGAKLVSERLAGSEQQLSPRGRAVHDERDHQHDASANRLHDLTDELEYPDGSTTEGKNDGGTIERHACPAKAKAALGPCQHYPEPDVGVCDSLFAF